MNGKPDVGPDGLWPKNVFEFPLDSGAYIEITFGIAFNGVGLGRPIPPVPQGQQRLVSWSAHPVGIDQVGVLQVIEHGPRS
jgi:hypothetical protein